MTTPNHLDACGVYHKYVADLSDPDANRCPGCDDALDIWRTVNDMYDLYREGWCKWCLRTVVIHEVKGV
uniref:Uncharacterized protein n=1 Tax=viral metagenome TaxID=1070528 RepID=A0A6M3KYT9_9ZZZZ